MRTFLIYVLFIPVIVSPKDFLTLTDIDNKIISLTFNEHYLEAKQLCDSLIHADSLSPKYYFYFFGADALEMHAKTNYSPVHDRDEFRNSILESSILKLEFTLDKLEDIELTPENKFYVAGLYGYLSRATGLNRSWWSALRNGTTSIDMFEEIIEEHPDCYDAYLMPGMFLYYADRLSGFTSLIASLLGISGDRQKGLEYITLANEKGKITFAQSTLLLLEISAFMEDNGYGAIHHFDLFTSRFPENKRVANWYCHILLRLDLAKEAGVIIKHDSLAVINDFIKARYYFLIGDNKTSTDYSKTAFDTTVFYWRWTIEYTKYLYVFNNWILENDEEVEKYIPELRDSYKERINFERSNESETKYLYQLNSEVAASGESSKIGYLISAPPKFTEEYHVSLFNLLKGVYYFKNENYAGADTSFQKSKQSKDRRLKTRSLKYLLDIYLKTDVGQERAEILIDEIEDSDYQKLIYRIGDLEIKYDL